MTDVAARAGVSHQTVSRVVNGFGGIRPETRARVLAAIEELGYRRNLAARRLASSRSGLIGVVSWGSGLYGPSSVVTALEDAALHRGYEIALVTLRDFGDESVSAAALDNAGGARAAVRHLLDLGHESVVHVAGPADFGDAAARVQGWR